MTPPLAITSTALSRVNNLILDAQKLGQKTSRKEVEECYGALLGSKREVCEYIADLEKRLGITRGALVKF